MTGYATVLRADARQLPLPDQDRTPKKDGDMRKPFWLWRVTGWESVAAVATELRPWLGTRRGERLDCFMVPALPYDEVGE